MGDNPKIVPAGEFIVGSLAVAGIIKPEDSYRAVRIVEEELEAWLANKLWNEPDWLNRFKRH
jgi:hypothetical protein